MKQFNVIMYDFNRRKFEPYDIIPYLTEEYDNTEDKPKTFEEFKEFILRKSMYMWWARCQYEIILSDWPTQKYQEKWDIYKQIKMNINIITEIFINEVS